MIFHFKKSISLGILLLPFIVRDLDSVVAMSTLMTNSEQGAYQQKPKNCKVRVLLDEKNERGQWNITTTHGVIVSDLYNERKKNICKQPYVILCFQDGCFFINGKRIAEKCIKIDAIKEHLSFGNKTYQGSFLCVIEKEHCFLINQLDLEDYVYCVLRSESWPGWPLEVNKVFAIASRTYVVTKVLESSSKRPYHIKDTNIHQTYNGFHTNELLRKAVDDTKGLITTYNKKPIIAMFDSCCGGIIPADLSGVNFKKSPYLARTKVCDFCKPCKIYEWKLEMDMREFEKLLESKGFSVYAIKDIKTKHDKAGAVRKVVIKSARGVVTLTGKQFYALSPKIKSFCYSIMMPNVKKICITGKGYGHHLGICQWGARNMIDQGWTYRNILSFFYPGTTCMKLTLK